MKILIYRYEHKDGQKAKSRDLAIATNIEDAADILFGLVRSHKGEPGLSFGLMHKGKRNEWSATFGLGSIGCAREHFFPSRAEFLSRANRYIEQHKAAKAEAAARYKFIIAHGGFSGPLKDLIEKPGPFREAWAANRFDEALRIARENGIELPAPQNSHEDALVEQEEIEESGDLEDRLDAAFKVADTEAAV